ncbi:MAG: peptide chain release factor N(5)-glutamine methyltransferase [Calditerrivibrio sp.]|nr:peptide chain release factor N(5)-glutamine methyltransferase [Calditerrivibrio sp.]
MFDWDRIKVSALYTELLSLLPSYQAKEFLSFLLHVDYDKVFEHLNDTISLNGYRKYILQKVFDGYPVAYVTKKRNFYGYDFYVDERVLIPRHESEILVESALKLGLVNEKVLDICTGSGVLLLAYLLEKTNAKGVGVDISLPALDVSKINRDMFVLTERADLVCMDVLSSLDALDLSKFDVVLCNPPYVANYEKLDRSLYYEPSIAIFAGEDRFLFYKKLLRILSKSCKKNTVVFFEIGIGMKSGLEEIFQEEDIYFIKDYAGIDRVMVWTNSG